MVVVDCEVDVSCMMTLNNCIRVNERRYEFGDVLGDHGGWVCSKVPHDGRIMKDCVPKHEAPTWYVHLQDNVDFQGCNGGHCYCDDRDGCNVASHR